MADPSRLEDLKRRVQKDPASLAFAQLAEEYRRAGGLRDAVRVCRAGLRHHPEYHSARVTLARALLALGELEPASREFGAVLHAAPENLAALRGLAEVHLRSGREAEALCRFRDALALAPGEPELLDQIAALERVVGETVADPPPDPLPPPAAVHSPSPAASGPVDPPPPAMAAEAAGPQPADPQPADPPRGRLLAHLERWLAVLESPRPR